VGVQSLLEHLKEHIGRLFILSGPSGSGKDAVLEYLSNDMPSLEKISRCVTATTRQPRNDENEGVNYYFLQEEDFLNKIKSGFFLEYAKFTGYYYGTPLAEVKKRLEVGDDILLKIEVQGAADIKKKEPRSVMIFIAPPSLEELERRLHSRNSDSTEDIQKRLEIARKELEQASSYDYLIINNKIPQAADELRSIIISERARIKKDFL
jgi:guanylate kinase